MSTIRVQFFGPSRQLAGAESAELPLPVPATIAGLRITLSDRFAELAPGLPSMRLAINLSYATDDAELKAGDEVAVIPPVSGGSGPPVWAQLFASPLPVHEARAFVSGNGEHGGIVMFEGVTRAERDAAHGDLRHLDYEAYEVMALRQMRQLLEEARARWAVGRAALLHRVGCVPPGEPSVVIAVAAAHRAEAFEACRFLIDALKRDVPIWKKDVYTDGFVRFVEPPVSTA